jgi:ParB-like chromosome segregation protein Spo0J
MPEHDLKIKRRLLSELRQHEKNPRNGDIELIAESLHVNGQFKPIVVGKGGVILAGNHTYQAALSLEWETIETVTLNLDPYSPEASRIMLADNRTGDMGRYDDSLLALMLTDLSGDSLVGSGYEDKDLADLTSLLNYRQSTELVMTDDVGSAAAAQADGSVRSQSLGERVEAYAGSDSRSLILPYQLDTFGDVTEALEQARGKAGVPSNADAVWVALKYYLA